MPATWTSSLPRRRPATPARGRPSWRGPTPPQATPPQQANAALALAKIGQKPQAVAIVRRLMTRSELSPDTLRLMFFASVEAGEDTDANALMARMSRGTASRDVASLQETMAIRQSDRLREQHNLTAAYDVLTPYVTGPSPNVAARMALARVYKDFELQRGGHPDSRRHHGVAPG